MRKGKLMDGRGKKAKEAFANSLMKISDSLFIAFIITISVPPFTAFSKILLSDEHIAISALIKRLLSNSLGLSISIVAFEAVVLGCAYMSRVQALDIYDKLFPDEAPE